MSMKPDNNIVLLDTHRGVDTSSVRFPEGGCCQPPPGAKMTVMLFYAKRAAKEELKARGIRVSSILPRDVRLLAEELLRERSEEFERLAQLLPGAVALANAPTGIARQLG